MSESPGVVKSAKGGGGVFLEENHVHVKRIHAVPEDVREVGGLQDQAAVVQVLGPGGKVLGDRVGPVGGGAEPRAFPSFPGSVRPGRAVAYRLLFLGWIGIWYGHIYIYIFL